MSKIFVVAGVVVAACLSYIGGAYYIGSMISGSVASYERWLLGVDDVSVTRLSYERRLFGGTLSYDITIRPSGANPLRDVLEELTGGDIPPEIKLVGRMEVRHGPWVGKFAAARTNLEPALPEELRPYLPKYPGQAPWVKVDATVGWSGGLSADFRIVDYAGRVGQVDDPYAVQAVLEGAVGQVSFSTGTPRGAFDFNVPRLHLGNQTTKVQLEGMRFIGGLEQGAKEKIKADFVIQKTLIEDKSFNLTKVSIGPIKFGGDAVREWSLIWSGVSSLAVKDVHFENNELRGSLSSFSARSDTTRKGDHLSSGMSLEIGSSMVSDMSFPSFALQMTMRNIEGGPINDILEALEMMAVYDGEKVAQLLLGRLGRSSERLLAAGPELAFDRVALSVRSRDDIKLSFALSVVAGTKLSQERLGDIADALEGKLSFTASLSAIEELMLTALNIEAGNLENSALKAERKKVARDRFLKVKDILSRQPMFFVDGDKLRLEAAVSQSKLKVNGNPVEAFEAGLKLGQTFEEAVVALLPPAPPLSPVVTPPAALKTPNAAANPAFGQMALKTDFEPDPQRVQITAGGDDFLDGRLGLDCKGYIDAGQPDFVLDYSAGRYDLFFYVESNSDTGLIVRAPDGKWLCNDDGPNRGVDPTVHIQQPKSGKYAVWIAMVDDPSTNPALLLLSEANPDPQLRR